MINLRGTIHIPFAAQPEALPALEAHIEATRAEPGNVVFEITPNEKNFEIFHVYEVFTDEEAFSHHTELTKTREWAKISADFEHDIRRVEK